MKFVFFGLALLALGACARDTSYHYTPAPPPSYLK